MIAESGDKNSTVSLKNLKQLVEDERVYGVAIGDTLNIESFQQIASSGLAIVDNYQSISKHFNDFMKDIVKYQNSYYLLEYLSPKRGDGDSDENEHTLVVKLHKSDSRLQAKFNSSHFEEPKPYIKVSSVGDLKAGQQVLFKAESIWGIREPKFNWQLSDSDIGFLTINLKDTSQAILNLPKSLIGKSQLIIEDEVNKVETTIPILIGMYHNVEIDFDDGIIPETLEQSGAGWRLDREGQGLSLRSGDVQHHEKSSLVWKGYFDGNSISFRYRISSEEGCDEMLFLIDGKGVVQSGDMGWREIKLPISSGEHTFEWVYRKDRSVSKYRDALWIDNIRVTTD
jgi:hypothetical protein